MQEKVGKNKKQKIETLWATPMLDRPVQLTDPSYMVEDEDGNIEAFAVAWNNDELETPKEVPNTSTFAGYAEIKHIQFVNAPKSKVKVEKEPTAKG